MRRLLQHRSRDAAILLLDDVHWIDPASDVFLAQLVDAVPGTHFLLMLNFRPEYRAAWMGKSSYQQLPLYPLGPEASQELLADLLGISAAGGRAAGGAEAGGSAGALRFRSGQASPSAVEDHDLLAALAERIAERTGGNPFFIEEVVRALVEAGHLTGTKAAYRLGAPVDEITIPATVTAVLAARIDRLGEREKAVLQAAAVIGKEFSEPVLRRVVGAVREPPLHGQDLAAALAALTAAEFLYPQALYPVAEYAFKHPLTQEVAYHSQLGDRHKHVHAAVARAIETLYPTKLDERAALLAYHREAANEPLTAAEWHRRAAEWMCGRDRSETLRHWQCVRALLARVPESPQTLALGVLARAQMIYSGVFLDQADESATLFAEGIDLVERLGRPESRVMLLHAYSVAEFYAGAVEEGLTHLSEAVRLADQSGNDVLRFLTRGPLIMVLAARKDLREALAISQEVETLCGGDPDAGAQMLGFSPYGMVLVFRGSVLTQLGCLAEAAQALERATALAQVRREPELLITAHAYTAVLCEFTGDGAGALQHARRAAELAEATTGKVTGRMSAIVLGRALLLNEQWSDAAVTLGQTLAEMREGQAGLHLEASVLANLARPVAALGDFGRARVLADEAVTTAQQRHTLEVESLLARAHVQRLGDGAQAAAAIEADLQQAMAEVEQTEARAYAPLIHVERAELARLLGDEATYLRKLREARRLFVAMGATGHVERISRQLSAVSPQHGKKAKEKRSKRKDQGRRGKK